MKKSIRVFPDYGAFPLWNDNGNVELEDLGINDKLLEITLRNWSDVWDERSSKRLQQLAEDGHLFKNDETSVHSNYWFDDGQKLVDIMNERYGDKYIFTLEI
jgi:hypothetical protein